MQTDGNRVVMTLYSYFSDAQVQLTLYWCPGEADNLTHSSFMIVTVTC